MPVDDEDLRIQVINNHGRNLCASSKLDHNESLVRLGGTLAIDHSGG